MSPTQKGPNFKWKILGTLATVTVLIGGGTVIKGAVDDIPPPAGEGDCLISNRTDWGPTYEVGDCTWGTLITRTNTTWVCNVTLSTLGPLPIRVQVNSTTSWPGNGATIDNGCRGDGNDDTIDLILEIEGTAEAGGVGPGSDAAKFRPFSGPGPQEIQMTGIINCGPQSPGAHSDGFQIQMPQQTNGNYLALVNMVSGDYDAGVPACQAAGGIIFYSSGADVDVFGGEIIGCNKGINGGGNKHASGSVWTDVKARTGSDDHINCADFFTDDPCQNTQGVTVTNVTAERWNGSSFANQPCTS